MDENQILCLLLSALDLASIFHEDIGATELNRLYPGANGYQDSATRILLML
jgi:hypothetical protein